MKLYFVWGPVLSFLLALGFTSCSSNQKKLNSWAELALKDLEIIQNNLKENHPAVISSNEASIEFKKWFEEGYSRALELASATDNFEGYYFSIKFYTAGFKDGHLSFGPSGYDPFIRNFKFRWPKFLIDYKGPTPLVSQSETSLVPNGSFLLKCNGKTIESLLDTNVFPFYDTRGTTTAKITWAPRLFMDSYNPFIEIPMVCDFKINDQIKTVKLNWEKVEFNYIWPKYKSVTSSNVLDLGVTEPRPGVYWVSIPTFAPDDKQAKIFKSKIINKIKKLSKYKAIIFDVRGNTGGDSSWGTKILEALYGETFINEISKKISTKSMDYRVSIKNIEYFESVNKRHREQFGSSQKFFVELVKDLKMAQKNHLSILQFDESKGINKSEKKENKAVSHTFVLTDYQCFSACLSFIDILKEIPDVTHIGTETDSDAIFMNTGSPVTMSYQGFEFKYPMIYMNGRHRKNNQSYFPKIEVDPNLSPNDILKQIL